MKNKILYISSIILFAMLLLVATNVNAAEYSNSDKSVVVTMNDLGVGGKTSVKFESPTNAQEEYLYNTIKVENVKQATLNEYAKQAKRVKANIRVKIPNDITKVILTKETYDSIKEQQVHSDKELKIETINGSKYVSYDFDLRYDNISDEEPADSNIASITLHSSQYIYSPDMFLKLYKSDGSYKESHIDTSVTICSENEPFNSTYSYENKYGQKYPVLGGFGGADESDKWYLTTKTDISRRVVNLYGLPTNVKLSETYLVLDIDVYQGDKIEVEGMGTLNYVGISKTELWGQNKICYVYKNSLDKLKKPTTSGIFKAKTKSGYTLSRGIHYSYELNEGTKEEQIKVEGTDITLNKIFLESDNLKVGTIKARKTDKVYSKLKNGYEDLKDTNNDRIDININDICIASGTYSGNINIEFNVGTENNRKEYIVDYAGKEDLEFYVYNGTVKDGKITITVDPSTLPHANDDIIKPGDINEDGKINTKDARETLLAYIGKKKLTEKQRLLADVNRDGKVNTKDARQILLYYIGKIKNF